MLTRKEGADRWIIGVNYHPSVQPIAFVNTDTGECGERRPSHIEGEAEKFYRELKAEGCRVRVGMEATGHGRWFEGQLAGTGLRAGSTMVSFQLDRNGAFLGGPGVV